MTVREHGTAPADPAPLDYATAKRLAVDADPELRRQLAGRSDTAPEILYYLAEDEADEVRREIAGNAATPRQADLLLARDGSVAVRHAVACKMATRAPSLRAERPEHLRRLDDQILDVLSRDQAVRVREVVAQALKDLTDAPPEVIGRLARDVELAVAAPILEHSPVLGSADLLDIVAEGPAQGGLAAIARRAGLPAEVADAVVGAAVDRPAEAPAIAALLANDSAQIREETLDRILDRAPAVEAWHPALVRRPALPQRALRRLAGFVAESLLEMLQQRPDLDPETARAVAATVRRRLEEDESDAPAPPVPTGDQDVSAAIARGDRQAAMAALARESGLDGTVVERILTSQSPKGIVALAWKAGLPARLSLQLQQRIAGIPTRSLLNPREGVHYPLSEQEMRWQIEFFHSM